LVIDASIAISWQKETPIDLFEAHNDIFQIITHMEAAESAYVSLGSRVETGAVLHD
jgi:hypothetical protein